MHRHRELCERAVDALEIAAGLEAHGVTDRTAARFRHRDVFSLAEEMYARVPRDSDSDIEPETRHAVSDTPRGRRPVWAALALLPGTLGALTLAGLDFTGGRVRLAVGAGGVLAVSAALRAALRRGPLRATTPTVPATRAWTCWLLAYALLGDGLLSAAVAGGPDEAWAPATALLALAFAVAPGAWCAQLFGAVARRRLASSRGLEEFAASVRPLLLAVFALFLCALWTLIGVAAAVLGQDAAYAGAGMLGALLLLARLLTAHGRTHAPAVVLGAATAAEVLAVCTVFAGRLPGCGFLAVPVETAVDAWGPAPYLAWPAAPARSPSSSTRPARSPGPPPTRPRTPLRDRVRRRTTTRSGRPGRSPPAGPTPRAFRRPTATPLRRTRDDHPSPGGPGPIRRPGRPGLPGELGELTQGAAR